MKKLAYCCQNVVKYLEICPKPNELKSFSLLCQFTLHYKQIICYRVGITDCFRFSSFWLSVWNENVLENFSKVLIGLILEYFVKMNHLFFTWQSVDQMFQSVLKKCLLRKKQHNVSGNIFTLKIKSFFFGRLQLRIALFLYVDCQYKIHLLCMWNRERQPVFWLSQV